MLIVLIGCVALLTLALAVTGSKLNKLRANKCHTPDHCHYYRQTGKVEVKTKESIYAEVEEVTGPTEGQKEHYQDLSLKTMEKRQYATLQLHGKEHQC